MKRIPSYVDKAVLYLADHPDEARWVEGLMPHAAYRVACHFINGRREREIDREYPRTQASQSNKGEPRE